MIFLGSISAISAYDYITSKGWMRRVTEYYGARNWMNTFALYFSQLYADELLGEASTG